MKTNTLIPSITRSAFFALAGIMMALSPTSQAQTAAKSKAAYYSGVIHNETKTKVYFAYRTFYRVQTGWDRFGKNTYQFFPTKWVPHGLPIGGSAKLSYKYDSTAITPAPLEISFQTGVSGTRVTRLRMQWCANPADGYTSAFRRSSYGLELPAK